MFTWPLPQGRRHSRRVTNPATAEYNMSRMYGYFSADRIFQFDRLDERIDSREISNIPTTRSLSVLNLETEKAMGTCWRMLTILPSSRTSVSGMH
ncbi:hypothetical protein TNCV_3075431 [Trichonephila clavipes]|nr:hypothetical protein TNCV_3075431 [Trichonephila clavipes]